jgi:signal transduction histidine kinase
LNLIGMDSEDEILGKICHNTICPAEVNQCPIIDLGQNINSLGKELLDRNGKSIPILKTVLPVNLEGEDVLLEAFVDISDLKATEAALTRAKVAEQANQTKSDFLANMSHELRTPLNHIIGFTELVVDQHAGDLNETQAEYLGDVLTSSRHLLSLINDILDLSKVEAGKLELEVAEIHLRMLLEGSLSMVKEKALKHRIQLLRNMDGIPEIIQADERKLKQILYNLLSNAVKFTSDGGSVALSARNLSFREGQWFTSDGQSVGLPWDGEDLVIKGKGLIEISVRDAGIGIKGEDLKRIFDPFEQVESSASRRYQGTGLGLSLTRRLVELHGGRIWAESEGPGKGSRFSFLIPIRQGDQSTEE